MNDLSTDHRTGSPEQNVWCLAQVKPNSESIAERNLLRQGFGVFAPKVIQTMRFRGQFRSESKALFPGYLFVKLLPDWAQWRSIASTLGVSRLVSFGADRPCTVPSEIVDLLQQRCNEPEAASAGRLCKGDAVRIASGPFADFIGRIESVSSAQRIWILLDIMGHGRRISIKAHELQPVL